MKFIQFDNDHFDKGMNAIVSSGTVVWTAEPNIYGVPDGTIKVLKKKRVPFKIISYRQVTKKLIDAAGRRKNRIKARRKAKHGS